MPTATASSTVEDAVNRRRGDLIELSPAIHAEPELAFNEHRRCAKTQALVEGAIMLGRTVVRDRVLEQQARRAS